jgi:hypothetical protein
VVGLHPACWSSSLEENRGSCNCFGSRKIRERLALGDFGLLNATAKETLDEYAKAWLRDLSGNLKASTVRFYGDNLRRYILPTYGTSPLAEISREDCRELIAVVARG